MEPSRWLLHDDHPTGEPHRVHRWWLVLWLTGVDYFSTLGYQPGIALLAAGALAPLATALLVAVTLLGALPVYSQVAARSYAGQGSIAMLENLLPGWLGKLLVLALLGFAATDFVITITLSAADATQHAIENPFLHPYLDEARVAVTLGLIALLALVFLQGFAEAIGVATLVAIPYLGLNLIVLGRGLWEILRHPELMESWRAGSIHRPWRLDRSARRLRSDLSPAGPGDERLRDRGFRHAPRRREQQRWAGPARTPKRSGKYILLDDEPAPRRKPAPIHR